MTLQRISVEDLHIEDESSFRHVELYGRLKAALRAIGSVFCHPEAATSIAGEDDARLLNLAFWRPGDVAEVLPDDVITADQLAHNAWHAVVRRGLGDEAASADGLLLGEAIASAFDLYMVGRLLGHAPESQLLATQVPAMADAAAAAGLGEAAFAALLERCSREPEASFEQLRQLLFDVSVALVACDGVDEAATVLEAHASHHFAPLLHHYELSTWVLFARCYGQPQGPRDAVRALDRELRAAGDPVALLSERWLGSP